MRATDDARTSGWAIKGIGAVLCSLLALAAIAASARADRTVYVGGPGAARVAALDIGANGSLTVVSGSPFAAGNGAGAVALTPDGRRLYVSNTAANTISGFAIDANGALAPLPGSPFAAPGGPRGVAVSPDGRHLYVANSGADTISGFAIGANGALTGVPNSPFGAGDNPVGIAVSPGGGHLYATNQTASTISGFAIASNGSLSALAGPPPTTSEPPAGIGFTPGGDRLYVAGTRSDLLDAQGFVFGFDVGAGGALTAVPSSPFAAGDGTNAIAVSPNGLHVVATNDVSNDLSSFAIGADGSLTETTGSPIATATRPRGVAITPDGRGVYVSGDDGNLLFPAMRVSGFGVGAGGAFTPLPSSPFNPGMTGMGELADVATTPNQPPIARFGVNVGRPGFPSTFDASASSDSDGAIVRYDWDFGDGTTLANGGPTPTHTFPGLDDYQVTLTVTDNEGCSRTVIYTGQTASCNGGPGAHQAQIADLDPPRITVGGDRLQVLDRTITVKVSADEPALAIGKGKLVVRALEDTGRRPSRGNVRSFRLKPGSVVLTPGKPGSLKMKLSRSAARLARVALEEAGRASANINVSAFDAAENEDTQTIRVQLRLRTVGR